MRASGHVPNYRIIVTAKRVCAVCFLFVCFSALIKIICILNRFWNIRAELQTHLTAPPICIQNKTNTTAKKQKKSAAVAPTNLN